MITRPVKYTTYYVLTEVREMLEQLRTDKKVIFLQDLIEEKDYTRQRVFEWKDFEPTKSELEAAGLTEPDKDLRAAMSEISDTLKKVEEILETRLMKYGLLKGGSMPIFLLKTIYGHNDRAPYEESERRRNAGQTGEGSQGPGTGSEVYILPDGTKLHF